MTDLKGLDVNTRVELDVDDIHYGGKYVTRVMDISDTEIRIMAPTYHGELVYFPTKTPLSVTYVGDRALYSFQTRIVGRFKEPLAGFRILMPRKVERIQRREFVRLEVKFKFRYRMLEDQEELEDEDRPFVEGSVADISAGGIRFYSDEPFVLDSLVEMLFEIEGLESTILLGRVVRNQPKDEIGYDVGVAFEDITPVIQDKIISWIFEKQREFRRKGLA